MIVSITNAIYSAGDGHTMMIRMHGWQIAVRGALVHNNDVMCVESVVHPYGPKHEAKQSTLSKPCCKSAATA